MAIFSLNSTVIARAAGGLYGLKIGTSTMNEALAAANASGVDALFNALYTRDFGTMKVADVAKSIVTNVGITGTGVDAAVNYVSGQLTASANKGATVVSILNAFSTLTDATYGAAAARFNAQVAAAVSYAQTAGNQDAAFDALATNAGAAFNLTNIADVATASVFNANQVYVPGGTNLINSLQNDDVLTGAGAADVLNAVLGNPNDNGVAEISPDLKGIETLNLRFDATSTSMILDMQDSVGAVNVNISRIADGKSATVKNITEATANKLSINNTNSPATGTVTFTYTDAATTPAAQAVDLTLNNARTSGVVLQSATGNTGFESITVTSSGAANSVGTFTAQDVQTLTIKGDKDLSLGTTAPTTGAQGVEATRYGAGLANVSGSLTSVDASTLTGALSLTIGTEIDGALDNTSGLAVRETITGGTGSDTFRLSPGANVGGSTTNTDVINGGAGTDTIVVLGGTSNITAGGTSTAPVANVRSIEALQVRTGHDDVAGNDTEVADSVTINADAFDSLATIYVRNEGQQMTNSSVATGAIAEQQQIVVQNTASGQATFLGVAIASSANADTATVTAGRIVADKAAVLAGATAIAAGLTDISASGAVLTLTFGGAGGTGDVGPIISSAATSNTTVFNIAAELRKGVAAVQSTSTTGTNEANNIWTSAVEGATTTLNNLTAAQATAVTIAHGTSGNNGILGNSLAVNLKTSTGASDTAGVTIVDGVNADPRFNFILSTTATANATSATNATENLIITDSDTESNTVALASVAQHIGTVTLSGGAAGNFLNLDTTTAGANGGLMQYGVNGTSTDVTSTVADLTSTSGQVKISALTIAAGTFAGNIVARVTNPTATASATGAQSITLGTGNDILILDNTSNLTAGLGITDTIAGGTGTDTLVIDGDNAAGIALSASEFTNVTGFETFRFIGNGRTGTLNGTTQTNGYSLSLNDAAVTQNAAANILNIVNDNGIASATVAPVANVGITIDVRALSAGKNINYDGQETDTGATVSVPTANAATAVSTAVSGLANATTMTADRFIFADANINATAVIDGGADRTSTPGAGTAGGIGHARNADVLEVRNASVVSLGDLAGIRNVSNIEFTNDTAVVQTSVLQLADATVDAMVNSTLPTVSTDTTTIGNSYEILNVTAIDSANVTGAFSQLNLDGSLIVNAANIISVTGGGGADTIIGGAGADTIVGGAGADVITAGLGNDVLYYATDSAPSGEVINGGAGTDTLIVTTSTTFAAATFGTTATNTALTSGSIENIVITSGATGTFLATQLTGQAININATAVGAANLIITGANATANFSTLTFTVSGGANAFDTGTDTVTINVAGTTAASTTGTTLADVIAGSALDDTIDGGTGADTITGGVGADSITSGTGADVITGGAGIDTITLTADVADIDTIVLTDVSAVANRDVVTGFTTTVDKVRLSIDNTTVTTANAVAAVAATSTTAAATLANNTTAYSLTTATSTANDVIVLSLGTGANISGTLANATDGTELLKAIAANGATQTHSGITATTAADKVYFLAVQAGTSYLYYASAGAGDTLFAATEILLVGTFSAATLVGGDFVMGTAT